MAIGFRAYKEFERPAPELVEAFRGIPSSNIGDCTQRMNCMFDGIRPFNDLPLVGTAFTVRVPSGDNLVAQAAELLEAARKNLQDEQEAMARMKAGTFPVEEHLESFTGSFLRRGGELL